MTVPGPNVTNVILQAQGGPFLHWLVGKATGTTSMALTKGCSIIRQLLKTPVQGRELR